MTIKSSFYPLKGGLDLTTPAIQTPAGRSIACQNYEPNARGYGRVDGFERFDGQTKPSEATYYYLEFDAGSAAISEGDTVTGATSGATGIALIDAVVESGAYGTSDADGYLVLTEVSGTFADDENLQVSAVTKCVADGTAIERGADNDTDDTTWIQDAIETARGNIAAVPGSGDIRGIVISDGDVFAIRDNSGATAGVMHKATSSGWTAVNTAKTIPFDQGGAWVIEFDMTEMDADPAQANAFTPYSGDTIAQAYYGTTTSGSGGVTATTINSYMWTGIIRQIVIDSGSWAGKDAVGRFVVRIDEFSSALPTQSPVVGQLEMPSRTDAQPMTGHMFAEATSSTLLKFEAGDTVEGVTSGATADINRVYLTDGSWELGTAQGDLIVDTPTGTFQDESVIDDSGTYTYLTTRYFAYLYGASYASSNALPAGGRYDFISHNFTANDGDTRIYGVNGVGAGFEWDGSVIAPINTGNTSDIPTKVAAHRNHLFFSFAGGSVQHSAIGDPRNWEVASGAGEIGFGVEVTELVPDVSGAMAVMGTDKVSILYGDDSANWQLKTLASDAGAYEWTAQIIGRPIYMDSRGIRSLDTTEAYGDFSIGTLTKLVEPLLIAKRESGRTIVASVRVRSKDQYRLFYDDGSGITLYFGRGNVEVLPFDLGVNVTCAATGEDSSGNEILFIGSDDGMVYQLDAGTSFDGSSVESYIRLPFHHVGSPQQKKRFTKVTLELDAAPSTDISMTSEFSYANPLQPPAIEQDFTVAGSGGFWDELAWNDFYWSASAEGQAEAHIDGIGNNISITVVSNVTYEKPHTLHGLILNYSYRGQIR